MTSGRQLALAISLFTAAVAALFATRWGMWFDEVMTVVDTARPLGEMLQQRAKWGHAPLYFTLIWGWQRLAGDSDFMLRLPAAAFAGLSVYAVFRLVRVLRDDAAGCAAAALCALNPLNLMWGSQARMYTLVTALTLLLAEQVVGAPEAPPEVPPEVPEGEAANSHPSLGRLLLIALLAAALAYTHNIGLLAVATLLGYALVRRRPAWRTGLALLLGGATIAPWQWFAAHQQLNVAKNLNWTAQFAGGWFDALNLARPCAAPWLAAAVTLGVITLWAVRTRGEARRLWLWLVLPPWVGLMGMWLIDGRYLIADGRYLAVSVMGLYAMAGMLAADAWRRGPAARRRPAAVGTFAIVVLLAGLALWANVETWRAPRYFSLRDIRWQVDRYGERDVLLVLPDQLIEMFRRYFPDATEGRMPRITPATQWVAPVAERLAPTSKQAYKDDLMVGFSTIQRGDLQLPVVFMHPPEPGEPLTAPIGNPQP